MLSHYLHTASAAAMRLNPVRDQVPLPPAEHGVAVERVADGIEAMAWFRAERRVLLGIGSVAVRDRIDAYAWQLPCLMSDFADRGGYWHDWEDSARQALTATERLADPRAQAMVCRMLGVALLRLGSAAESYRQLRRGLALFRRAGDDIGYARSHLDISSVLSSGRSYRQALRHAERSLAAFCRAGHEGGQGRALNGVGWCHALLGSNEQAISFCQRGAVLCHELGDKLGEAAAWDSLGRVRHQLGQYDESFACYWRAVMLCESLGARFNSADARSHLADALYDAGNTIAARHIWNDALAILDELHHPRAEQLRTRLRACG